MAKKRQTETEKKEERRLHQVLIVQMISLSTAGFGIVAALAWNETIQQFVKDFIEPRIPGSGLLSKFIYAILVTLLAVLITYQLSRIAAHFNSSRRP